MGKTWDKIKSVAAPAVNPVGYTAAVNPVGYTASKVFGDKVGAAVDPIGWALGKGVGAGLSSGEKEEKERAAAAALAERNAQEKAAARARGESMISSLYGESAKNIGADSSLYTDIVREGVNKQSVAARDYMRGATTRMALANKKAGMSGVDTAGLNEELYRKAKYTENKMQQDYTDAAVNRLGKNVAGRQQGVGGLSLGYENIGVAGQEAPRVNYDSGILGTGISTIICTELKRQGLVSYETLQKTSAFGKTLKAEEMYGYHVLAAPMVKLMKHSPFIAKMWVGWALSLAENKPSLFTKVMIKVCGVVGKLTMRKTIAEV